MIAERALPVRRMTRAEYDHLVDAGLLGREDRVELVYGMLVPMTPQKPSHGGTLQRLNTLLVPQLVGRAEVRVQLPFIASDDSEPEPDLAVVAAGDYFDQHPRTAHLVIEVADTSLNYDRKFKAALYAEAGVPEYWVVDVAARVILVHRLPSAGQYERLETRAAPETLTLAEFPDVTVPIERLFPKR